MTHPPDPVGDRAVPRVERLTVSNYRALRRLDLKDIRPLSVFVGPNGSGKSTLFDVFAFLAECFTGGLRTAWDKRGRFRELRTREQEGPIIFEIKYREAPKTPLITYHLEIDEDARGPFVAVEWLRWKRKPYGAPFRFLDFRSGSGRVASGEVPDAEDERIEESLDSRELLAVNTLGQLAKHPRVSALRRFITGSQRPLRPPDSEPRRTPRREGGSEQAGSPLSMPLTCALHANIFSACPA